MNGFCPEGYLPTQEAIVRTARFWFQERFAALKKGAAPQSEAIPDNSLDAVVRILSQSPAIPYALRQEFQDITNQVVYRLRDLLHQGKLTAYYFRGDGRHAVSSEFWATTAADGTLESGTYWPFGEPAQLYQSRPNYPLFLQQSELDALLIEQPAKKRPLPKARISDVAIALHKLEHLPSRKAQFQALCNMPEFREYEITNSVFREAARQAPRRPGRPKSRR